MHGRGHENRAVGSAHRNINNIAMCHLHHIPTTLVLEIEVEVQPVAKVAHAIHVEELLEVILGTMMHRVILIVPCCRVHHGGRSGSEAWSNLG